MYIKSIELQGFKSFFNKTKIDLKRGITAVVGPNGCGKTNIIDAVRWVLGEQKQSTLRSSKMEDVIFNGTKKIKPINFCEVKLTINNDLKILPIEYSDVEIIRRLFRSGESEYYINKASCRLKDIHQLFIDTGMSFDAYSVIELKMIEAILSNDSLNFKKMLDEAAGINHYNKKRRLAKRQLKHTLNDLDRVNDIISEVKKNIRLFDSQMKKYKKHKNLIEKLKDHEILLSSFKFHLLMEKEIPILKQLKSKDSDRKALDKDYSKIEKFISELEKKYNISKQKMNESKNQINTKNNALHSSNAQIIKFSENKKYNNSQMQYHKDEISQSKLNIKHIDSQIKKIKNELTLLKPIINDYNENFKIISKKYNEQLSYKNKLLESIDKNKALLFNDFEVLSNLKNNKKIIRIEIESIEKHLLDLKKFKYDKNCKYCIKNGEKQINEKKDIKNKLLNLNTQLKDIDLDIKKNKKIYQKKEKKIEDSNNDLNKYNKKNESINQDFQNIKIKKVELAKEEEGLNYRKDSFKKNKENFINQISDLDKKINFLDQKNKILEKDIENEKENSEKLKIQLKKLINDSSKWEKEYDNNSNKLKEQQHTLMLNQRRKEEKIIDRKNFEIQLAEISNDKKNTENIIKEKYNEKIISIKNPESFNLDDLINKVNNFKNLIEKNGPINMAVEIEYDKEKERFDFLTSQKKDLIESEKALDKTIRKLDKEAKLKFINSFNIINKNLSKTFAMFFDGGEAQLKIVDDNKPIESDIEIIARPPGKKNKALKMLSAGEKALTATAVLFAIYLKKPSPFCILDEIDSPLDDINIKKFTSVIKNFSEKTQFIVITHNKLTMKESDYIYGITQEEDGISTLVSAELKV